MKEIGRLNKQKASLKSNIPIKIFKDSTDIFADYIGETVNSAIKTFNFPNWLKLLELQLYIKKVGKTSKKTIDRLVFYQHYLKYLKEYFSSKWQFL